MNGRGCAAQSLVKVLVFAFLLVGGTVGLLIVLMLYVLDLRREGWTWHYVALFGAMLASTDAVAIVATMKSGAAAAARLRRWDPGSTAPLQHV